MKLYFLFPLLSLISLSTSIVKYPSMYEVSARPWLYSLSLKYKQSITSFKQIPDEVFNTLKSQGFTFIWVMGVWSIGSYGVTHDRTNPRLTNKFKQILPDYKDTDAIGSPYAITDYICNPELCPGGNADLMWLKSQLNERGMYLMLDFVPNHSALDSSWVTEHIEYYIRAPKGMTELDPDVYYTNGIAYGSTKGLDDIWSDVGQLNYFNKDTRALMLEKLLVVAEFSDAIRVDTASFIVNRIFKSSWKEQLDSWGYDEPADEFWPNAIKTVKAKYPNIKFFAEVFGELVMEMLNEGFDYAYEKGLLDVLMNDGIDTVKNYITYMRQWQEKTARFLENHDDNRAVAFFDKNEQKSFAAALIAYTLPSMRFFFQDCFYGYKNKLDVHLLRAQDEPKSESAEVFYDKLFKLINSDTMSNGKWEPVKFNGRDGWKFLSWKWLNAEEKIIVVVNFSDAKGEGNVVISDVKGEGEITIKDMLSDEEFKVDAEEVKTKGFTVSVSEWYGRVLQYN